MIQKYTYGTPFETDAIVTSIPASEGTPAYGTISTENGFSFTYDMDDNDVVYGLGESNRGINKRGYVYDLHGSGSRERVCSAGNYCRTEGRGREVSRLREEAYRVGSYG